MNVLPQVFARFSDLPVGTPVTSKPFQNAQGIILGCFFFVFFFNFVCQEVSLILLYKWMNSPSLSVLEYYPTWLVLLILIDFWSFIRCMRIGKLLLVTLNRLNFLLYKKKIFILEFIMYLIFSKDFIWRLNCHRFSPNLVYWSSSASWLDCCCTSRTASELLRSLRRRSSFTCFRPSSWMLDISCRIDCSSITWAPFYCSPSSAPFGILSQSVRIAIRSLSRFQLEFQHFNEFQVELLRFIWNSSWKSKFPLNWKPGKNVLEKILKQHLIIQWQIYNIAFRELDRAHIVCVLFGNLTFHQSSLSRMGNWCQSFFFFFATTFICPISADQLS